MKQYDFDKAKQLISENAENLASASLGMHEDWRWTAETIWQDGAYVVELAHDKQIAGIQSSNWATPTIQLIMKDDTERFIPCYFGDSDGERPAFFSLGVLSSPMQEDIAPLEQE